MEILLILLAVLLALPGAKEEGATAACLDKKKASEEN